MAEFAANNGASEMSMWTPLFAVQGTDLGMTFWSEPAEVQDHQQSDADHVEATTKKIYENLGMEMQWSQVI